MKSGNVYRYCLIVLLLWAGRSGAQIVINEISYNPPESGNDSLEYIELYNAGGSFVNLFNWYFSSGVEDTLPDVVLSPGEYFVTAISSQAMHNVFGIDCHQWAAGALNNSGEPIVLVNAGGVVMDSVMYDDTDPWPVEADGSGPSLELKDPALDNNDGANWQNSGQGTGIIINGAEVMGTPGAQNSGGGTGGPAVTIEAANLKFTPRDAVVRIGDLVRWVNNEAIPHNVNGSQIIFPGNVESFNNGTPAAGPWQYDFTPSVAGLNDYRCDLHFGQGMTGTLSVYDPNNYTDFPLAHLRKTDGVNGQHLFVGVPTRVTGVVHGINFQPTGYSFYVIDQNNVGINVFSFDPGSYTVTEGDMVRVSGTISQFNGLLEIVPDAIEVLATNQNLNMPRVITMPNEDDESSYVTLFPFFPDSVVATGTSGFNVYAKNMDGGSILIRLDADAGIDTTGLLSSGGVVGVVGVGTQFDASFPYTEGYQILAFALDYLPGFPTLPPDAISMNPNPAGSIVQFISDYEILTVEVFGMDGKRAARFSMQSAGNRIDAGNFTKGMYIVKATTSEGIWTSKLLIQ